MTYRPLCEALEPRLVPALVTDRTVAAFDFATSTEFRTNMVQAWADTFQPGVAVDVAGLVAEIQAGRSERLVFAEIFSGAAGRVQPGGGAPFEPTTVDPEFGGGIDQTADEAFIRYSYQYLLVREPEAAGFEHWKAELANGMSRETFIVNVVFSIEYAKEHEAEQLYARNLEYNSLLGTATGRVISEAEFEEILDAVRAGAEPEDLRARIWASDEYFALHSADDEQSEAGLRRWIDKGLYGSVLLRAATAEEVEGHLFDGE